MDEQKLNKRRAVWAGFYFVTDDDEHLWIYPDEVQHKGDLPDFPHSLDACFKWLVPKLLTQLDPDTRKVVLQHGRTKEMDWYFWFEDWRAPLYHWAHAETPALALCLAIDKLIDIQPEKGIVV